MNKMLITWGENYDIAFDVLPSMMSMIVVILKYLNTLYHEQKFKELLMFIQRDTERLMNVPEYVVFHKYMVQGRTFAIKFMAWFLVIVILYLLFATAVSIHNEMHPINGTVIREAMYQVDYNVDFDKYYYLITLHCYLASIVTVMIVVGVDLLYIALSQHACSLFAVTGFRLKAAHILNVDALKGKQNFGEVGDMNFTPEEQNQIYKKLVLGVKEHQNVLEYMQLYQSMFSVILFIQLFFNLMALSITGVSILLKTENLLDFIRVFILVIGEELHLLWICYPGQKVVDFSEQLYYDALECMWYTTFKKSCVVYQFMIRNALKPYNLVALKLVPVNKETYLAVMKTTVSYFTVLLSMR